MTRLDILNACWDMAIHNLLCYSDTYMMNSPKANFEKEWHDTNEKISILTKWIYELENA